MNGEDKTFLKREMFWICTLCIICLTIVACVGTYKAHTAPKPTVSPDVLWELVENETGLVEVPVEEICVPIPVPLVRTTEFVNLTFEEMDFLQQIAMAESRGEDSIGQALVMLAVLNRSALTGMSIQQVFYARGQFSTVNDPMFGHYAPNENCNKALAMILDGWDETDFDPEWDTNEKVYYFGVDWPAYGNRGFQYGGHHFNTITIKEEE